MFNIGDLVTEYTKSIFSGIGKLVSVDEVSGIGIVAFFKSPLQPEINKIEVSLSELGVAKLFD